MGNTYTLPEHKQLLEEQIGRLNEIGIALSNERHLNRLLDRIVREARSFTNADGGSLYIKEEDRLNFAVAQTESLQRRDGTAEPFKKTHLPLTKESIAGYVASTGEILNIHDVYDIPPTVEYRVNKQFDVKNRYRSKSMLVVPMREPSGNILGVLQLINSLNSEGEVIPFKSEYESLVHSLASQAAVAIRNVRLLEERKRLFRSLVRYSAKAIDARSPHTAGHSGRVAKFSVRLARAINAETTGRLGEINFTPEEIEELRMAGWLHDIGKIGVREYVLEKSHKLSEDQIEVVRQRFESIKQFLRNRYLERKVQLLVEQQNGTTALAELDKKCENDVKQVDDCLDFILRINVPGILTAGDSERLRQIAEKSYYNSAGEKCFYLTHYEYENLSIARGNLTESEYREMQSHVDHTLSILNKIPFTEDLENIPKYAAAHHEYLDGSGYPNGLKGEEISIQARIMCIADIFDALSSPDRPYKQPLPIEETLHVLRQEALAGKLDADIVDLFIRKKLYQRPELEDEEED